MVARKHLVRPISRWLVPNFLQADTEEGQAACDKLGVDMLPTVQFWRSGKKLWEHRGILHLEQDLGEGAALCALGSAWRPPMCKA